MKKGTFQNINGRIVRAVSRDGSCEGCVFDGLFCPAMVVQRSKKAPDNRCYIEGVKYVDP